MSDREFENYLALLSRLLNLSAKHRQKIAGELRAHLEDRLEELIERGVSKDEAVQQALAEFGDAAGLAGQFVAISRQRKRRWLMRMTTFSVAATLLLAAGIAVFWPGRNAAPGIAAAVAQAPSVGSKAAAANDRSVEEPSLLEKLNKRIDLDVIEVPLKDVVAYLQENTAIQFVLRTKKLEEAGVSLDMPISKSLKRVRLSTLLDLVLSDLELTYVEKDDLLLITTPEDAEATMEVRVYDCRDLLRMEAPPGADKFITLPPARSGGMFAVEDKVVLGSSSNQPSAEQNSQAGGGIGGASGGRSESRHRPVSEHDLRANRLMQIITNNVDNQSWDVAGGPGSISEYNGLIVVTQTAQTHKKVEHVLDMLREAAGLEVPKTGKVVR